MTPERRSLLLSVGLLHNDIEETGLLVSTSGKATTENIIT